MAKTRLPHRRPQNAPPSAFQAAPGRLDAPRSDVFDDWDVLEPEETEPAPGDFWIEKDDPDFP